MPGDVMRATSLNPPLETSIYVAPSLGTPQIKSFEVDSSVMMLTGPRITRGSFVRLTWKVNEGGNAVTMFN
jgi:hypothetical protein